MHEAIVFCKEKIAGILSRTEAGYGFRYLPEYLAYPENPPISLSFPKQIEPFSAPNLFPFFFGLLAEGEEMVLQCRLLRIDEDDHFARLIKTCGAETIGGVTVKEAA